MIPSVQAETTWLTLRELFPRTSYWPLFIDDISNLQHTLSQVNKISVADVINESLHHVPQKIFTQRTGLTTLPDAEWVVTRLLREIESEHDYLGDNLVGYAKMRANAQQALTHPAWNTAQPATLSERLGLWQLPNGQHTLVLVPAAHCQEIPARLPYLTEHGNDPVSDVSIFRYWNELYSAEPVQIGYNMLTLRATKPPVAREQALVLAWEHTRYCIDISLLDVLERAIELWRGAAWSFWWD